MPFDASIILAAIVYIRISIFLTVIMATYNSKNGLGGDRDTSFSLGLQIFYVTTSRLNEVQGYQHHWLLDI